ncbi:MAG: tyrosine--tRNA ligase [Anaerolineae bacterium]|nr:tyrosine--tRNA ligase [Anaerolineae bacterium]
MSIAERAQLITRNTEEVIGTEEIAALLEQGIPLRHYIGLEISGKIHLGTGLICMQKVRDLQRAGVRCTIFLADWHTWLNDKLGGDRARIKEVAHKYFKKGLQASLKAVGGDPDSLDFVLGSDLYHNNDHYWETLVQVCKNVSLSRMERSISIMGRKEGDAADFAMLLYPGMQVTDIFALQANFAHGGMDQRKAHVIARDVADKINIITLKDGNGKQIKPIIIHHHLLLGLDKPPQWPLPEDQNEMRAMRTAMKMSKSKPNSAVFIHDTPDEIRKKIRKAFCPPETDYNPVLDWVQNLVFNNDQVFHVARTPENGGDVTFNTFEELVAAYSSGALHPGDLKNATAEALIKLMQPIRDAFEGDDEANAIWQGM